MDLGSEGLQRRAGRTLSKAPVGGTQASHGHCVSIVPFNCITGCDTMHAFAMRMLQPSNNPSVFNRWGDGRDQLPAAAQQAQQHAAAGAALQPAATVTQQRETDVTAASASFASIGGLWKQKEALRDAVVLPLRHPRLFAALGAQVSSRGRE